MTMLSESAMMLKDISELKNESDQTQS